MGIFDLKLKITFRAELRVKDSSDLIFVFKFSTKVSFVSSIGNIVNSATMVQTALYIAGIDFLEQLEQTLTYLELEESSYLFIFCLKGF